jgi:hypothetical protein
MPDNAGFTQQQLAELAQAFATLAQQAGDMLADPSVVLSADQSNVMAADVSSLDNIAANLATWGAGMTFSDSNAAFAAMSSAATTASARISGLKSTRDGISSIIAVLGSAISLGIAFGTGNKYAVGSAAVNFASAAGLPGDPGIYL